MTTQNHSSQKNEKSIKKQSQNENPSAGRDILQRSERPRNVLGTAAAPPIRIIVVIAANALVYLVPLGMTASLLNAWNAFIRCNGDVLGVFNCVWARRP